MADGSRRRRPGVTPAAAALVLFAACGGVEREPRAAGAPEPITAAAPERIIAPAPAPERIIAVAPSLVEILFSLGLGERVVAVGDYVSWPPAAASRPRIGGLFDPRLEDIVALKPDLAVVLPSEEELAEELSRLGIEVLRVGHESLDDVEASIEAIARRTGTVERGRELVAEWRAGLEARARGAGGAASDPPTRTALVVGRESGRLATLMVVGSRTYLDELLTLAGGANVFGDLERSYAEVGLEELLRRRPAVILELQGETLEPAAVETLLADWKGLAARLGREGACARVLSGGHVLVPGPRLPWLAAELASALADCGSLE